MAQESGSTPKLNADVLAGTRKDKSFAERAFPVNTLDDVLREIRRAGGTGKLEINFRDGHARGDAKWSGYSRDDARNGK